MPIENRSSDRRAYGQARRYLNEKRQQASERDPWNGGENAHFVEVLKLWIEDKWPKSDDMGVGDGANSDNDSDEDDVDEIDEHGETRGYYRTIFGVQI